jgi:polyisoprenoid-binding protein YceI
MHYEMTKKARLATLLLGLGPATTACDNDPGAGKVKAKVSEAAPDKAQAEPQGGEVYRFSEAGSALQFVGAKVTGKHDGGFGDFQGTIRVVDDDPTKSSVTVEVDTNSVESDNPRLTKHLKSDDFFNVASYPKATFKSTSIAKAGGKYQVTGNLNLHGVEKAISFPAEITIKPNAVDVKADFVINRKDFGIVYKGKPDDLIKDAVNLQLSLEAHPDAGS